MDVYHHRQIHLLKEDSRPKLLLKPTSTDSSDYSVSSVLFSICPTALDSNSYLSCTDNQSLTNTRDGEYGHRKNIFSKKSSLRSYLLKGGSSDRDSLRSYSPSLERKSDKDDQSASDNETASLKRSKTTKKMSQQRDANSLNHSRTSLESAEISPQSCLSKLLLRPQLYDDSESCPAVVPPPPPSCVAAPVCPELSPERLQQLQRRQIELDRAVERLMQAVTSESKKNIQQISRYWAYIKQICLDKYQPKGGSYNLFDYLLKSTHSNREYDLYFEENDEIQAALQVLTTTLTIVHSQHSFLALTHLFDNAEKAMREKSKNQLEALLSTYNDQLSFIRESIHFYQSKYPAKNFDWVQTIQIDYPCFIDKISNEFFSEVPSTPQLLVQMLRNTKANLLKIRDEIKPI